MTLAGHWPLSEDSGTEALDYSGHERTGSLEGGAGPSGTGTVSGPVGSSAYSMDGNDDGVRVTNTFALDGIAAFTASAWAKIPSAGNGGNLFRQRQPFQLKSDAVAVHDGSNWHNVVGLDIRGEWVHSVGVFNQGVIKYYQDGVLVASNDISSTTTTMGGTSNSDEWGIGFRANGSDQYVEGAISSVRIYRRALSPPEVSYLYNAALEGRLLTGARTA